MIDPRRAGDPNRFIKAIDEARVRAGLTQAELAERVGYRQSNYSVIVAGTAKRGGTIGTLDALAHALGLEFVLVTKEEAEKLRLAREAAENLALARELERQFDALLSEMEQGNG